MKTNEPNKPNKLKATNPNLPFFNLEIASTPNCNMACSYCFEGEELKSKLKQSDQNIINIIKRMDDLLTDPKFYTEYKGICINFWGGEPTINFDWNKRLIEEIRIKEETWGKKITYFIYSNGFDFKKVQKHIELFSKEELDKDVLRLQISWDGIPGERIDHKGNQTYITIEKNIKNIAMIYPNLNLKIKATIQPREIPILKSIWRKFFDLDEWVQKHTKSKLIVNYSPTLNYVDDFKITDAYLETIKTSFLEIANLELEYFKINGRHLFTWFESNSEEDFISKRKVNCSAGINIMAFDLEGNASVCHGSLYSPLKDDFIKFHGINIGTTNTVDFRTKFYETREQLKTVQDKFDDGCQTCTATVCYKCPIVNVEQSIKGLEVTEKREQLTETDLLEEETIIETFQDRDSRHCEIYKLFGLIDRALYKLKLNSIKDL